MSSNSDYDVAIIGASIAGCTAATLYGRQGLKVALVERQDNPSYYKKVCGHFIQPSAAPTIERLGIAREIEAAGGVPNGDISIYTQWGVIRPKKAQSGGHPAHGYNLRRVKLDPMLRRLAAGTNGVEFMPGQTARALVKSGGRFSGVVIEDKAGTSRSLSARLVVGADGRSSRVAELSGVPTKVTPNNHFCYFAYFRNLSFPTQMIWFRDPDWIYAFPNDDQLTLLTVYVTKDKLADFKRDVVGNFARCYEGLPDCPDLGKAEQVSETRGMIDIPNISRDPTHDGLAFIGDAALASDPMWGVGCGWAFQSAEWLVTATAGPLREGSASALDHGLRAYRKTHHKALAGHFYQITDYSSGRPLNPIERQFFSAAVKDQTTANHLAQFEARNIGLREFLSPFAIARAVWINLTRRTPSRLSQSKLRNA